MIKKRFLKIIVGILFITGMVGSAYAQPFATILLSVTVTDTTAPLAPTGLTAVDGDGIINLNWSANQEGDLAGYNLYRSLTSESGYSKLNSGLITTISYQDTGLINGNIYYYKITAVDASNNESLYSGEISVSLELLVTDEVEPNDSFAQANNLGINSLMNGAIADLGDIDYYRFTVDSPGILNVSLTNVPANINAAVVIYDSIYSMKTSQGAGYGSDIVINYEVASSGVYYVSIFDSGNDGISASLYDLKVTHIPGLDVYEPNPDFAQATNINSGDDIQATIFPVSDNDYYKITSNSVSMMHVHLTNVPNNINAYLTVYDSNFITKSAKAGINGADIDLELETKENEEYFIRVYDTTNDSSSLLLYNLQAIVTLGLDAYEPNNDFDNAAVVNLNEPIQANIFGMGDNDYYKVSVTEPGVFTVALSNVPANIRPYVYAYRADQSYLMSKMGQTGDNLEFNFEVSATGDYYIRVYDSLNYLVSTETYDLLISQTPISLDNVVDTPDAFSPNGDNNADINTITYYLTKNGLVTIKIYDAQDALVRVLKNEQAENYGTRTAVWDGKNDTGNILADGIYKYIIEAVDLQGNPALSHQSTITIENNFLVIVEPSSPIAGQVTFRAVPSQNITTVRQVRFRYNLKGSISSYDVDPVNILAQEQADSSWTVSWDTTKVKNGEYEISVGAAYYDLNGIQRYETLPPVNYIISNIIVINNLSVSSNAFSPNGDNYNEITNINYLITKDANVTINIYDDQGTLVRALITAQAKLAGDNLEIWDGKDNDAVLLDEGVYTCIVTATENWGDASPKQIDIVIDNHAMTITEPVEGNILSGEVSITTVPSIYANAYSVYLECKAKNDLWWTMINNAVKQPDASWISTWDTAALPSGEYELRVCVAYRDLNNLGRSEFSAPITCSVSNSFAILSFSDRPDAFSPNNDYNADVTIINYLITADAQVSLKIFDQNNLLIRTLKDNVQELAGSINTEWDGKDDLGVLVPEGEYTYILDAMDAQNNAVQKQGTITVDNHFLTITIPASGTTLSDTVVLQGVPSANTTVTSGQFRYRIYNVNYWINIGAWVKQSDGSITGSWDTTVIENNDYEVQAYVNYIDKDGLARSEYTIPVLYTVDNIAVLSCSTWPVIISPNADSVKDTTTLIANLSDVFDWIITIKDSLNVEVKSFSGNGKTISLDWDGKDTSDSIVADGVYTCYVQAIDPDTGLPVSTKSCAIEIDNTPAQAVITFPVADSIVSGNLDIIGTVNDINFKSAVLQYGEGSNPLTWVDIVSINTVVIANKLGEIDTGTLPNGIITFKIVGEDNAGNISEGSVQVTTDNVKITNVSANPRTIDPAVSESTSINFSLDRDANVTIRIYKAENPYDYNYIVTSYVKTYVFTPVDNIPYSSGQHAFVWDGRDGNGELLPVGTYVFTMEATAAGAGDGYYDPEYVDGDSLIDNTGFSLIFNPYKNENCLIDYDIVSPAWLTIMTFSSDGQTVRKLVRWEFRDAGSYTEYWDGRTYDGNVVSVGSYNIRGYTKQMPENYIIIKNSPISVTSLETEAYLILPLYDQVSTIKYAISRDAFVTIKLYDPNGSYYCTLEEGSILKQGGNYSVEWNGTNDDGKYINVSGDYRVEITLTDAEGVSIVRNGNIVVYK
ncbi:MAG: gliding motility-associated C-terminal domain-containing protein [Candidatus Omnitrophica bacterium]|nr:gliding motility-associated C-terminal domain-containing protein [Candidatus Omnitrophota bacterium]